jgi:hypothetical protein
LAFRRGTDDSACTWLPGGRGGLEVCLARERPERVIFSLCRRRSSTSSFEIPVASRESGSSSRCAAGTESPGAGTCARPGSRWPGSTSSALLLSGRRESLAVRSISSRPWVGWGSTAFIWRGAGTSVIGWSEDRDSGPPDGGTARSSRAALIDSCWLNCLSGCCGPTTLPRAAGADVGPIFPLSINSGTDSDLRSRARRLIRMFRCRCTDAAEPFVETGARTVSWFTRACAAAGVGIGGR